MVLLLKKIINWYYYVNNELQDPRITEYPLMSNPFPIFAICSFYLYFVTRLGPRLMKDRKPMNIDKLIIAFNISQIVMCAFLVYKFVTVCSWRFNWFCEPIDYGTGWYPTIQIYYAWIYHLIKILDLLDTIFFVMRKKFNQISFLHLYHHTGMVIMTWMGVKFIGGGHGLFIGFANCIVHTCMYFYYLMSIWDEKYKKSIWWKKYITQLQMGQFFFLVVIFGQTLFQPNCTYPKWVSIFFLPQNIFMLILFSDFYYRAYVMKKPQPVKPQEEITSKLEPINKEDKEEKFSNSVKQRVVEREDELKAK